MIVFDSRGLHAVIVPADELHEQAVSCFREAVDQDAAWTTSFALAELDRRLVGLSNEDRRSVLERALGGLEIVWVGPELLRRAVRHIQGDETVERTIARLIAGELEGRCFPP